MQQFEINGIRRDVPGSVADDFSCSEVINLRNDSGVWRPVLPEKRLPAAEPVTGRSFLHTTGDTQQLVTQEGESIVYRPFPELTEVSVILSTLEAGSVVRFDDVGNILVVFVEPGGGGAPYTQYAVWKDVDGVQQYALLPELPVIRLEYALVDGATYSASEDSPAQAGRGALVAAYRTAGGSFMGMSPITFMNYGTPAGDKGRKPVLINKKFEEILPEEWHGLMAGICIFATVSQSREEGEIFDYLNDEEVGAFRKVYEIIPNAENAALVSRATCDYGLRILTDNRPFDGVTRYEFWSNSREVDTLGEKFVEFTTDAVENPTWVFKKTRSGVVTVKISIDCSFNSGIMDYINQIAYVGFRNIKLSLMYGDGSGLKKELWTDSNDEGAFEIKKDFEIQVSNETTYALVLDISGGDELPEDMQLPNSINITGNKDLYIECIDKEAGDENTLELKIPKKDTLVTRERLNNCINHQTYGACHMAYNARLFLGDTTSVLFRGYGQNNYYDVPADTPGEVVFVTHLKKESGHKVVLAYGNVAVVGGKNCVVLPTVISYPDSDAYKVEVFARVGGATDFRKVEEFLLVPVRSSNYAYRYVYAWDKVYAGTYTTRNMALFTDSEDKTDLKDKIVLKLDAVQEEEPEDGTPAAPETTPLPTESNTIHTANNTCVSEMYVPMVFPFEQYNTVGNKGVVGFSTNALSIDASNFGVYPVFVFAKEGVYAMQLGSAPLVQRITPLSGDVCLHRNGIVGMGGATAFVSEDGVRLLTGQQSEKMTAALEQYVRNPLSGNRHFEAILDKYGVRAWVSDTPIQEFLTGARLYFIYKKQELVMTNEAYDYCYVYSLARKVFYKLAGHYTQVFNDYPRAYGLRGGDVYELSAEEEISAGSEKQPVFVQTNPFKLGTDDFDRLQRLNVRLRLTESPGMGAYLFVSNDAQAWAIADGKEKSGSATNINYLSAPASVKYGILVMAGQMDRVEDCMTHVTAEYRKRYENKVR